MTTTDDLIEYYAELLIAQYNNKPKAIATVQALVSEIVADQIIQQVEDGFDIDTALGAQLTTLGIYVGAPRNIFGLSLTKTFFAMPSYSDPSPLSYKGFAFYSDPVEPFWYFAFYADADNLIYILSDSDLRTLIKYLADVNSSDHGLGAIDEILFKYFGNYVTLNDNLDMTITYLDDPSDPSNFYKIVKAIGALPSPAGVQVNS